MSQSTIVEQLGRLQAHIVGLFTGRDSGTEHQSGGIEKGLTQAQWRCDVHKTLNVCTPFNGSFQALQNRTSRAHSEHGNYQVREGAMPTQSRSKTHFENELDPSRSPSAHVSEILGVVGTQRKQARPCKKTLWLVRCLAPPALSLNVSMI
eukprot:1159734-Pelagomonas_calceolata.AAC.2